MKKIIFSIVLSVFSIVLTANNVSGCDCLVIKSDNPQELIEYAYESSDSVFSGEVIRIEKIAGKPFVKVTIEVEESWKSLSQKEAIFIAENEYSDCGYGFKVGEKYLIYAEGEASNLKVDSCTRTSVYKLNEDIEFLNKIKTPKIISAPK